MNILRPTRLVLLLEQIRSSYLFVPALMLLGSAALAFALIRVDQSIENIALRGLWWIFTGGAEGARSLLSTVAGSAVTVAGTVFSITIAVLSLTSSQFGPRLLRNFLRDTSNQVVLGTFLGTFLYCLLVLRTVRSVEEVYFVPHIAVTGGVALAIASVCMLVYYIHHILRAIQAEQIVSDVARELEEAIDSLFPEEIGDAAEEPKTEDAPQMAAPVRIVSSETSGYVQAIDGDALLALAQKNNLRLTLRGRPGRFLSEGETLAEVIPVERITDEVADEMRDAFSLGRQRTAAQDMTFVMMQLAEVAVRALSPGINDPFTALHCLNWLQNGLCRLARRRMPSPFRYDEAGELRITSNVVTFAETLEIALGEIRLYGKSDPRVLLRLVDALGAIARAACTKEQREALRYQVTLARQTGKESLPEEAQNELDERCAAALQTIADTPEEAAVPTPKKDLE